MNDIYRYIHHLKKCPFEFRKPSKFKEEGGIHTDALILDVLRRINPEADYLTSLRSDKEYSNYSGNQLSSIHIACWFFSFHVFKKQPDLQESILDFMFNQLEVLSEFVNSELWLEDEDREEEFVRLALFSCGIIPDGETEAQSKDRLDALSTLKRNNVLNKSHELFVAPTIEISVSVPSVIPAKVIIPSATVSGLSPATVTPAGAVIV